MMEIKFWNNLKDSLLTEGKNGYRFQLKQSLLFPRRKQKDYRYGNSYVIRDPFSFFLTINTLPELARVKRNKNTDRKYHSARIKF